MSGVASGQGHRRSSEFFPRRSFDHGSAPVLVAVLMVCCLVLACRREPPAPRSEPELSSWPVAEARSFLAGPVGLVGLTSPAGSEVAVAQGDVRVGAVAAREDRANGRASLLVALEGWGLFLLEVNDTNKDGAMVVSHPLPSGALAGLRVGGAWPSANGFLVQTYRDPFGVGNEAGFPGDGGKAAGADGIVAEDGRSAGAAKAVRPSILALAPVNLGSAGGAGGASAPSGRVGWGEIQDVTPHALASRDSAGFGLFALLPDAAVPGGWLAFLRSSSNEGVRSEYYALATPPGADAELRQAGSRTVSRAVFEAALAPKSLLFAPSSLKSAFHALVGDSGGSAMIVHGGVRGFKEWFVTGKEPSAAREFHAWSDGEGRTLVTAPDGRVALGLPGAAGEAGPPRIHTVPPPLPDAFFTGCCFVEVPGGQDLVLALLSWEEGGPGGASGIFVTGLVTR